MSKTRRGQVWWGGLVAMLGLVMAATAQQAIPPLPRGGQDATLRTEVSIVNMFFTVRDNDGRPVKHLSREQFRVTDNGQPQNIAYFSEEADQPLALAIALDASASVESRFEFERRATADFVRSILRPGKDQALLITFAKHPHLAVGFTDRAERIEQGMTGLKAQGGTALFDAARLAVEHLSQAQSERRVLVLVTDGEDTVSWTTLKEVLSLAVAHNVIVYTLGVKPGAPGSDPGEDRRTLAHLSEETGGVALFPKDNAEELAQLFSRIQEQLRDQYSLAYALPPPDGKAFRQVSIEITAKNGRVHARRGYYVSFTGASPVNR